MNDELRQAFDRLDAALAEARAALGLELPEPERVRAACAREGVPCPEEEKPETVDIISANTGGIVHLHDLRPIEALIEALIDPEHGPCLRVNGYVTKAPISDIRKQAAEAGIDLPEVTVNIDSYRWTAIERADCHVCDDGSLLTGIIGVAERYGEHTIHTSTLTPAQVVVLCELAGWPKPKVLMVLTHCDGDPCTVDPCEDIVVEYDARWHATSIARVPSPRDDGYEDADEDHIVREPVAVVEAMLAACKEGE